MEQYFKKELAFAEQHFKEKLNFEEQCMRKIQDLWEDTPYVVGDFLE